jgi:hypothetical protein
MTMVIGYILTLETHLQVFVEHLNKIIFYYLMILDHIDDIPITPLLYSLSEIIQGPNNSVRRDVTG